MAIETCWNENLRGLIHHSDQGVQYASEEYIGCLKARGNPYDNAFVESFIRTLKYEDVYLNEYETFSDALDNIAHHRGRVQQKEAAFYHRVPLPIDFEKEKEMEMEMEKGVKASKVLNTVS